MFCEFKRLVWRQYGLLLSVKETYPFLNSQLNSSYFVLYNFQLTIKTPSLH